MSDDVVKVGVRVDADAKSASAELSAFKEVAVDLGDAGKEAAVKAASLQSELDHLGNQKQALDALVETTAAARSAGQEFNTLGDRLDTARQRQVQYDSGITATASALDAQRTATADLNFELSALQIQLTEAKGQQASVAVAAREAGASDAAMGLQAQAAKEQVEALTLAVREKSAAFNAALATEVQLERALTADQAAAQKTSQEIERLATASGNLQSRMQTTSLALSEATDRAAGYGIKANEVEATQERLGEQLQVLRGRISAASSELTEQAATLATTAAAYDTLGVKSEASMRQAAEAAREALRVLQQSGTATAADLNAAFASVARAELEVAAAAGEMQLKTVSASLAAEAANDVQRLSITKLRTEMFGLQEQSLTTGKAIKGVAEAILPLLGLTLGVEMIHQLGEIADEAKNVDSRLRLATDSVEAFKIAEDGVEAVALKTRNSLDATAELYYKLSNAVRQTGGAQADTLKITEAINQAVTLSGVGAQTATNGIIQFSQGLAAGTLQGQDLRSVLEDIPALGQAIADGMGVSISKLRQLAAEGKLTPAEILGALENAAPAIQAKFEQMTETIAGSLTNLKTSLTEVVGNLDKTSGASAGLVEAIEDIGAAIRGLSDSGAIQAAFGAIGESIAVLVSGARSNIALLEAAFDGAASAVGYAAGLIALALSKITFGDLSKNFAEAADVLENRADELAQKAGQHLQDFADRSEDSLAHIGGVMVKTSETVVALASDTEQSSDRIGKANAKTGDTYLQAQANAKAYTAAMTDGLSPAAQKLVQDFATADEKARKGGEGIGAAAASARKAQPDFKALFDGFNPRSAASVDDVVSAMDRLREIGKITSDEYEKGIQQLISKISAEDLPHFVEAAQAAFGDSAAGASKLGDVLDAVRTRSLADLGVDAKEVLNGVSQAALNVIGDIEALGASTVTTADEMSAALAVAIPKVETKEAAEALKSAVAGITVEGFNAAAAVKSISDRANELPSAAEKLSPLNQAYKELGITSSAALQRTATAAEDAYKALVNAKAPIGDLERAFAAMAAKQLDAAAAQGDTQLAIAAAALQGQASTQAEITALDDLIAKYPSLANAADAAAQHQVKGAKDVSKAISESADDQGQTYDSLFSKVRNGYAAINDAALELYDKMLNSIYQYGQPAEFFMEKWSNIVSTLDAKFADQKNRADQLTAALEGPNRQLGLTINQAEAATRSMEYLDSQTLSNLTSAISNAKAEMQSLEDTAQQTLESLQDQLDQLNDNQDAIQQRQNERKKADIQAQIEQAKAIGDRTAVQTLQQSLALLNKISTIQNQQAAQQKAQAQSPQTVPATSATSQTVNLNLMINGHTYPVTTSSSVADALIADVAHAQSISTGA